MTIFVNLASFCDPHLEFTLDGLYKNASSPNEVFVGLVDQTYESNRAWLSKKSYWENIRYIHISPIESRGVCWARYVGFSLFQNEKYFLQIDSHTHFDPNWDITLKNSLDELRTRVNKPIISTYPPPFIFNENNDPVITLTPHNTIYALRKHPETNLTETCATLRFRVEHEKAPDYIEGYHVAGGFIFTVGDFVTEIPYDPYLYFHGEEQSLALRAYTRGWNIFHPLHEAIPLYHLYKQKDNDYETHHWHSVHEQQRQTKWVELKKLSDARLVMLISNRIHGCYGLGDVKSLAEFDEFSGINYSKMYSKQ